jgi:hypothetical protein
MRTIALNAGTEGGAYMAEALPNAAQWSTQAPGALCLVGTPARRSAANLPWDLMPMAHYSLAYLVDANYISRPTMLGQWTNEGAPA